MSLLTGLKNVDEATTGIQPGELWGVFGGPGSGKSRLVRYITAQVLLQGGRVLYVDTECPEDDTRAKILAQSGPGSPSLAFLSPVHIQDVWGALDSSEDKPDLLVIDTPQHLFHWALDARNMHEVAQESLNRNLPILVSIQENRGGVPSGVGAMHSITGSALRVLVSSVDNAFTVVHAKCRNAARADLELVRLPL